jgi:hypothetical protein
LREGERGDPYIHFLVIKQHFGALPFLQRAILPTHKNIRDKIKVLELSYLRRMGGS